MRKLITTLVLLMCFMFTATAIRAENKNLILTSLDVTQALCRILCEGTSIEVEKVIPAGYSMQGQKSYFKKHRKDFFSKAEKAQGVVTIVSVWPDDPLYLWARRGNIRIVNIDAAKPLDGYGAGVPLMEINGGYSPYVWRSPANLTRMGSIVADDLGKLFPEEAEKVTGNLKKLQSALFRLRTAHEEVLLEKDSNDYAALTDGYVYLVDEFGLNVHFYFMKQEENWADEDYRNLGRQIKEKGIRTVICPWEPEKRVAKAINDAGSRPAVLNKFVYDGKKLPLQAFLDWYERNLTELSK